MKEFDIFLDGTWYFSYSINANTKEEAIKKAKQQMDMEACPIDIQHINQWFDGKEETRKKEIFIANLETGSLTPVYIHMFQDEE